MNFPVQVVDSLASYRQAMGFWFEDREGLTPDPPEPDQKRLLGWAYLEEYAPV